MDLVCSTRIIRGEVSAPRIIGQVSTNAFRLKRPDKLQKSVVTPTAEFVPFSSMRGLVDEYGNCTERVVYLPGEIHDGKKPVSHIPIPYIGMDQLRIFTGYAGFITFLNSSGSG